MKKLFLVLVTVFGLVSGAFAAQNSNGSVVWADNFESMATFAANQVDFTQEKTGYNYSCGMFSLDLVLSYHEIYNNDAPLYTRYDPFNRHLASDRIPAYYTLMGQSFNTITSTDNLKYFVIDDINGFYAIKASGSKPTLTNLSYMKARLKEDYPVIIALQKGSQDNPVDYDHIVVVFKYDDNQKLIYYFEPYYGQVGTINASSASTIESAVLGNLPYLRVYPQ